MNTPASERGTDLVKRGLAEMLKGGVIMDVVIAEQARIAWFSVASQRACREAGWRRRKTGTRSAGQPGFAYHRKLDFTVVRIR